MAADDKQKYFDFFGLARELRDMIYGYAVEEKQAVRDTTSKEDQPETFVSNGPVKAAQLVSHQFSSEYEQQVKKQATLNFHDHEDFRWVVPVFGGSITSVERIKMVIVFLCDDRACVPEAYDEDCNASGDTNRFSTWLNSTLPQFSQLKAIELDIIITDNGPKRWPMTYHGKHMEDGIIKLAGVSHMKAIRVYCGHGSTYMVENHPLDDDKILATWTREDGWEAAAKIAGSGE